MITIRRANERGHADYGWLNTWHTFSFADYHDPAWNGFRSLRVINDDTVAPGMGFGMHGHRNMEILTYVLKGQLEHKDSMGNGRIIQADEVQYMSAGAGVRHSEFNPSPNESAHFLQIWIQPDSLDSAPRYADRRLEEKPPGTLQLIASKTGRDGSFAIHQDADVWVTRLTPGATASHSLREGRAVWIHVAEGEVHLEGCTLKGGDAVAVTEAPGVELRCHSHARVLVFDLA